MNKTISIFLITALTLAGSIMYGCSGKTSEEVVLARIDDQKITRADLDKRLENMPERYRKLVKRKMDEYLQGLIDDTLLYREAEKKGLDKDPEVRRMIEQARRKILTARLIKDEIEEDILISDKDIRFFYQENRDLFMTPEVMRVSHILSQSKEDALAVMDMLQNGADFEVVARAKSVDPTAQQGGDIGYFPKGQLMPEFERACAELEIGETSGLVQTKLGYHIIKLTDRREPRLKPVAEVKETIENELRASERRRMYDAMLEDLRSEAEIVIYEEKLDMEVRKSDMKDNKEE
jgi:peptidyl-prolyl cis-trans isomerase C